MAALAMSLVLPGTGHMHKGQWLTGWVTLLVMPMVYIFGMALSPLTAGFGMLLPLSCHAIIAFNAATGDERG